jgi:hypothetical protein
MKKLSILWTCIVLLAGCSGIPFRETPLVPMAGTDPTNVVERFKADSPDAFQLLNTIVFEYRWRKFSGLGMVGVDTKDRTFVIACINQMGVKLFELTGDREGAVTGFVMPELAKQGNFAEVVGEDIKRIYFDLLPSPQATIEREKYRQGSGTGLLEYVFAGPEGNLLEKNYYEDGFAVWTISYYEYTRNKGKLYPAGTILKNAKYGYSLMVKLKEIQE